MFATNHRTIPSRHRKNIPATKVAFKKPALRSTFEVVAQGTPGAFNIDSGSLSCKQLYACSGESAVFYSNRYNDAFWASVNKPNFVGSKKYLVLEQLIKVWTETGKVVLSHEHPNRANHSGTIIDYLMWELRQRGLATSDNFSF